MNEQKPGNVNEAASAQSALNVELGNERTKDDYNNEQWYDDEIAPELLALATRCKERGMSLVAVVEYEPGGRGGTYQLTEDAGLAMRMLYMCGRAGDNVDAYMIGLKRYCAANGIDTSASIFMERPNAKLT